MIDSETNKRLLIDRTGILKPEQYAIRFSQIIYRSSVAVSLIFAFLLLSLVKQKID